VPSAFRVSQPPVNRAGAQMFEVTVVGKVWWLAPISW
jgi:hypothetical protein